MAELAEYQQWLREGIKAGAAGDKNNKYLAHLAQYGEDAPFTAVKRSSPTSCSPATTA